ncbi:MAG: hypothetical protein E7578_06610 [Ruminococcaceae bacterium]|nr:hypothetical protein [Oscillospiraceae bacterium]
MSYIGKWVFHSIGTFGEEGIVYLGAEEYLNYPMEYVDESDPEAVADEMNERRKMISTEIRVCEGGELYMLMPLPEGVSKEEVDAAVAAGEITLYDGMMADRPLKWEDRGGELWYDTGIEGEVFGEKADSWTRAIDEDGFLNFINIRFKKSE